MLSVRMSVYDNPWQLCGTHRSNVTGKAIATKLQYRAAYSAAHPSLEHIVHLPKQPSGLVESSMLATIRGFQQ
jgi:hypothetical protein